MTPASLQLASRITPTQILDLCRIVETAAANMHAIGGLFTLIQNMTTEFAVVAPLSESGEKITNNVAEDLFRVMDQLNAFLKISNGANA